LFDHTGKKYIDLLGQNLCMSVGYGHPTVLAAVEHQMRKLAHTTTMYYHETPALLAKEIVAKLPPPRQARTGSSTS